MNEATSFIAALQEAVRAEFLTNAPAQIPAPHSDEPWSLTVRAALAGSTDGTAVDAVAAIDRAWREAQKREPSRPIEQLIRALDDTTRRAAFQALEEARRSFPAPGREQDVFECVEAVLGPAPEWMPAFKRFVSKRLARLVLIPTWQCELRCNYCWIPKQDGRVMEFETIERAIDLLTASDHRHLNLQFFGGEALIEWPRVQHAITYASARANDVGKSVDFVLSSNGWSLTPERLNWLKGHPVKLELSLDGDRHTQATFRRGADGRDSYTHSIAANVEAIASSGLDHEVIMVVQPKTVSRLHDNFFHVADLGFLRVQINFALGIPWAPGYITTFAAELHRIGLTLRERWAADSPLCLVNLEQEPMPVRLNGEVHVDFDGKLYGSNGFLYENDHKHAFAVGHLDDLFGFDRYWLDAPDNTFLLEHTYSPDVTANNLSVGAILSSFVRWMRAGGIGPADTGA